MPEPETSPAPKPPKRGRFRRALRWVGLLLLVVAIFHRPLFHTGLRLLLVQVAAKQNVKLEVEFSGTIFTNLTVAKVRALPTGAGPSPVRKIEIEKVRLDYSLPMLAKHGIGEFLQRYEIVNADLDIEVLPSKNEPEKKQRRALAEDLNRLLGQPAAYADRVHIQNFNITVRAPKNVTQVAGFNLLLDPEQPGYLRIARLQIPGVPLWENLAAETSYAERNFFIKKLKLAPQILIDELNFDASQRAQNKGSMTLKAQVFGGNLNVSLAGTKLDEKGENLAKSYDTTLKIDAAEISLQDATAYFGAPKPPVAKLSKLDVLFTGEPEKPRTWKGHAAARVDALDIASEKLDGVEIDAAFNRGTATVKGVNVAAGKNSVALAATVGLPASVNDFPSSDVDATLKIDAPELATLTRMLPEPFTGAITGGGPITLHGGWLKTNLALEVRSLANPKLQVAAAKLHVDLQKRVVPAGGALFDDFTSQIRAEINDARAQDFTVDTIRLDVANQNDLVTLNTVEIRRAENSITAGGTYRVPANFRDLAKAPLDTKLNIDLPKLEDFGIKVKDVVLAGRLKGAGDFNLVSEVLKGGLQITGGDFQLGEYKAERLAAKIAVADNRAVIEQITLQFNDTDQLALTGAADLLAPFPYSGTLLCDVKNLAAFQPLLTTLGVKQTIAGELHLGWDGKGEAAPVKVPYRPALEPTGQLDLALLKGRVDKTDLSEVKLAGLYGPGFAQSTELKIVTGPTAFTGSLEVQEGKLRLKDMNLTQAGLSVLTGFIFLPIDLGNLRQPFPMVERVAANINATNLDLDKLLGSFGQASPVSGTISANIVSGGTLLQPSGHLKLAGRRLRAKAVAGLDPADIDLDLHYSNKDLTLNATARQSQMQPLTIRGRVPLDLESTVQNARLDPTLPLSLSIQLPPSSLAVVTRLVPQIRRIDGTLGLDIRVAGTVERPLLSGNANLDLTQARMDNENIPAIRGVRARLAFANDTLSVDTFQGEVGGGTFRLGGTIRLPKLNEPVFDLRLQTNEVLVLRNDSITVRANADLRVAGPLAAATASGSVFVTRGRFFKEIDILPIALPGRTRPAPRTAQNFDNTVSFPQPPLRDMKFDIAIKTRPNDDFLIRGNLANGAAALDLRLAGTGLAPYLEGSIRVAEFRASLPFSTLNVTRGFVYFTREAPFQPSLDLQAESQTRDYRVRAFIFGRANDPQIQLSSEPPLPYSDIVSLLATGLTTTQLSTGGGEALASKAALLALQQLYRKIFHRGRAPSVDDQKVGLAELMDRFQLELGSIDPQTGSQQVTGRVRLTDQVYLLGEIGTEGNFTGRLKYLIRFR